eukprot:scaffold257879_cov21-Prasinocladus_malaysianus.AAC.1
MAQARLFVAAHAVAADAARGSIRTRSRILYTVSTTYELATARGVPYRSGYGSVSPSDYEYGRATNASLQRSYQARVSWFVYGF